MVELKRVGSMERLAKSKDPERSRLAQSQPSLQLPDKQHHSMARLSGSTGRLMQRKDILYSGSLHNIHLQHRYSNHLQYYLGITIKLGNCFSKTLSSNIKYCSLTSLYHSSTFILYQESVNIVRTEIQDLLDIVIVKGYLVMLQYF